jgi:hypothetical protein
MRETLALCAPFDPVDIRHQNHVDAGAEWCHDVICLNHRQSRFRSVHLTCVDANLCRACPRSTLLEHPVSETTADAIESIRSSKARLATAVPDDKRRSEIKSLTFSAISRSHADLPHWKRVSIINESLRIF